MSRLTTLFGFSAVRFIRSVGIVPVLMLVFAANAVALNLEKVVGPNACAECHKDETEAWKGSHHFKTFRELPRKQEAREIAKRMSVKRINAEGLCLGCHFTAQKEGNRTKALAGISCESCHGAGEDWIKVHSEYSGKTEQTETKAEEAARWKKADSLGMLRPSAIYKIAKNCYSCHVVPNEKLVNVGGHPAGSAFELLSWSQGEVRHNTWHSKGKGNLPASANRKRIFYLVGLAVEVETALRAIGKATVRKEYAFKMAKRADDARKAFEKAVKAVPNVTELGEIDEMVKLFYSAGLKLNNDKALTAAADAIAAKIIQISTRYDGSELAAIDPLMPKENDYKGQARAP